MKGDSTGWSYDKNGNELAAAGGPTARTGETYNDFNQLTALTTAGTTHHYTYAGTDSSQRLTEDTTRIDQGPLGVSATTTDGVSKGIVRDPAGTLIGMTIDRTAHYYTTSNQGAPSTVTSPTGTVENTADYGPTGNVRPGTTTTVDQPFGYTGAYLDTSGLYNMGARQYDRTTNRFTQIDPSGKETNAYLYAAGDPINRTDPTGTFSFADAVGVVAGTIAGTAAVAAVAITCPLTAGVTCAAAAIITGALWGAGGGALGATLDGGDSVERVSLALSRGELSDA